MKFLLLSMVLTACATQPEVISSDPQTVTITEQAYTAGSVVYQKGVKPDSALLPEVAPLSEKHIPAENDIGADDLMKTAITWAGQYHDLTTDYNLLKGWVLGVYAAQNAIIDANTDKNVDNEEKTVDTAK